MNKKKNDQAQVQDHSAKRRLRPGKVGNWMMLIGGYAGGQGALFLSQTWLVVEQELVLLADFGVCFSFAILAIMLVDFGFVDIMARESARAGDLAGREQAVSHLFWNASISRLVVAIVLSLSALGWSIVTHDDFQRGFFLTAIPAFLAWAFNGQGLLDGLRLSGLSGISGSLPYLGSAASVVLVSGFEETIAGSVVGGCLSLGYILSTSLHILVLRHRGLILPFKKQPVSVHLKLARSAVAALATRLPGQLLFRLQLLLSGSLLGESATALLVYAKQSVSAFAVMGNFLRRVEFPDLVQSLRDHPHSVLRQIAEKQKWGSIFGVVCFALVFCASIAIAQFGPRSMAPAADIITPYSFLILSAIMSQAATQGMIALGYYRISAINNILAIIVAAGVSIAFAQPIGLYAFVLADLFCHIFILSLAVVAILRRQPV